jgi:hypothetical protein
MLESDISLLNPEMSGHHHVLLATLAQLAKAAALTSSGYESCQIDASSSPARIALRTSREFLLQSKEGTHTLERRGQNLPGTSFPKE